MSVKDQQRKMTIIMVSGMLIAYFGTQHIFMKSTLRELQEEVSYQSYQINRLEDELMELRKEKDIVKNTRYDFKQYDGEGTLITYEIGLTLAKDFSEDLVLYYKTFESDLWEEHPLTLTTGEVKTLIELDTNKNYDLKIGYMASGIELYESLPALDLYTMEDDSWSSSIKTTSFKGNKLEFNIQLAKPHNRGTSALAGAVCKVYYDEALVDEFEVREIMAKEDQKPPRAQLEHFDSDYWFVNRQLDLKNISKIEKEKVRYEVEIHNERGNIFDRTYFLEE